MAVTMKKLAKRLESSGACGYLKRYQNGTSVVSEGLARHFGSRFNEVPFGTIGRVKNAKKYRFQGLFFPA